MTYALAGVGAAGIVAGGVLGALALERRGVLRQHCGSAIHVADDTACDPTGLSAAADARRFGTASTAALVLGLSGAAAAVVLRLTEPDAKPAQSARSPRPGVTGVLAAGPAGARVGLRASW